MKKIVDATKITHSQFPQRPDADAVAQRRLVDPAFSPSGVYRYYDRYMSRLCVGQTQHTLATGTLHACMRYTDAALLHFWGYRQRPMRGPLDIDFNIGIDIARFDLENCAWLKTDLEDKEQTLLAAGILRATDKRDVMAAFKFDRARFLVRWNAFFAEHKLLLDELRSKGEPAKHIHGLASEHFDAYSKCVSTADNILKP